MTAVLHYINEVNDTDDEYLNVVCIPKNCIVETPVRMLMQPNLDFIESNSGE